MTGLEGLLSLFLVMLLCFSGYSAFQSFTELRISRATWNLRKRVIQIERDVADSAAGTEADRFAMLLADICADEKLLHSIHRKAQDSRSLNPNRIVNVERSLEKAFGVFSMQISEAVSATAEASNMISTHVFLRLSDVESADFDAEKYVLFKELTKESMSDVPSAKLLRFEPEVA